MEEIRAEFERRGFDILKERRIDLGDAILFERGELSIMVMRIGHINVISAFAYGDMSKKYVREFEEFDYLDEISRIEESLGICILEGG